MRDELKNIAYKVCFYAGISVGYAMVKLEKIGLKVKEISK